jgi:hypothetical protein
MQGSRIYNKRIVVIAFDWYGYWWGVFLRHRIQSEGREV